MLVVLLDSSLVKNIFDFDFFCKKLGFFYLLYLSNYVHLYGCGIELELHT